MKDFLRRNVPVLVIGAVTLIIFVVLIILAQKNPPNSPTLLEIDQEFLIPDHTFFQGNPEAPLTLIEFSNYNCPHCSDAHPVVQSLIDASPDILRWGFRHLPFTQDPSSFEAAVAAQAAGRQEMFWEYTEVLFANQGNFTEENFSLWAKELGLNVEQFKADMKDETTISEVRTDQQYALKIKVQGTPTFVLNGEAADLGDVVRELSKYQDPSDQRLAVDVSEEEIVEIRWDGETFTPRDVVAKAGQTVRFHNDTDQTVLTLNQKEDTYENFIDLTISPKHFYEMFITHEKLWTYFEAESQIDGNIFVN